MTIFDDAAFNLTLPITIRQLERDDLRKLEWYGQFTHYRNLFRRSYKDQQAGNRHLLVADCKGYPVARLFIQLNGKNSRLADGETRAYLYSFHVMEMFRGQGLGTRLIDEAEAFLRQHGYQSVTIAVSKHNEGALRLYQRHGYQTFGHDAGQWRYMDHRGRTHQVNDPCWLLEKALMR